MLVGKEQALSILVVCSVLVEEAGGLGRMVGKKYDYRFGRASQCPGTATGVLTES